MNTLVGAHYWDPVRLRLQGLGVWGLCRVEGFGVSGLRV